MKPFFSVHKCHRLVSKQTSNCPFAQETVGMGTGFGNVVNLETESQCRFPKETWTFTEGVITDDGQSLLCWGVLKFS